MKSVIINITLSNPYIPIMYGWKDDGTLFITGIAGDCITVPNLRNTRNAIKEVLFSSYPQYPINYSD